MSRKIKPVDFENQETFGYILEDMTNDMNTLLRNMENMAAKDGKFTLTIDVTLAEMEFGDDVAVVPVIKHKIKSGFQVKHETGGQLDGMYVLRRSSSGNYMLEQIGEQLGMFDDDDIE